jgi:hypothetical protein
MANEKVLGVVSGTRDGKLLVVTTPTRCDDPVADEVYMGLVSGTRNGKPLVAISTQRCGDTAGTLEVARGYLGLVSGTRGGKLLLAVPCGDCATGDPTVCDVTMCCELEGTVRVKIDDTPTWGSWTVANPVCGGTSTGHWWWSCLNDEIEDDTFAYLINWTASEKDTLVSPEAYDTGIASGTRSCKTVIWSVEFDIGGETYRLTYYVTEYHIFQTLPTVVTTDGCLSGWSLQREDTYPDLGLYWNTIAGTELNEAYYNAGTLWMVNYEHDSPYGDAFCPEGYSNNGAEQWPSTGCFPLTDPCAEVDIIDPCNDDEDLV